MSIRKLTALLCAAAVAMPLAAFSSAAENDTITITKSGGDFESVYAEWKNTAAASSYTITCTDKNGNVTTADKELIRLYDGYYRVDVPGLRAGEYTLSIADSNGSAASVSGINVAAHKREGFAFSAESPNGGIASGGYNSDGTPYQDASVFYITQENVDTISAKIGSNTCKGLNGILQGIAKNTSGHYIIRIIGMIDGSKVSYSGSDAAKTHVFYAKGLKNTTIEGIGSDAVMNGCAFFVQKCSNFELRNIAEMLFLDDGIAIDGDNSNIWVHNNDIFYGKDLSPATGDGTGDADQVKGDGSLDLKNNSRYCTLSYNHFWDGGKVSLVIAGADKFNDTTSFLSYHHNWFDHTDSRHPRVRFATVHMYNNYFDGNATYGSGVTSGASLFAENNYYKDTSRPFASSMQGSDSGTFSKEAGGIIKAYGNYHEGGDKTIYYSSKTGSDFDAYKASARDEAVPSTVTTKQSTFKTYTYNKTYNNFDTASTMYAYSPDDAQSVPAIVRSGAGRVEGGDIGYTFKKDDAGNHSRMAALDALLLGYKPSVRAKLLTSYPATDGEIVLPTAPPAGELTMQTAAKTWSFENYDMSALYDNMRFYFTADKPIGTAAASYDKTYGTVLDLQGAGALGSYRSAEVYTGAGEIKISVENTGTVDRTLAVYVNGQKSSEIAVNTKTSSTGTVKVTAPSLVQLMSTSGGLRICYVSYTPDASAPTTAPTAAPTAKPTAAPTAAPTAKPTAAPTTAPTAKPTAAPPASDLTVQTTAKIWNFENYDMSALYDNMRFYFTSGNAIGTAQTVYDKTFTTALDLKGGGRLSEYRAAEVYTAAGDIKINIENTSSSDRALLIYVNGELQKEQAAAKSNSSSASISVSGNSLVQFMSKSGGLRICSVEYTPSEAPQETTAPTAPPQETTAPTAPPQETTAPSAPPQETTAPTVPPQETAAPTEPPQETTVPSAPPQETTAPTEAPLTLTASRGEDGDGSIVINAELTRGMDARLYTAVYGSDGRLISIVSTDTTSSELQYSITLPNEPDSQIRLMLWKQGEPICNAVFAE